MSPQTGQPPPSQDWRTTDQDEIERRRQRARDEAPRIENRSPDQPIFGNFRVHSPSGFSYEVEIRDLRERHFACTCVDFRINGLATCKHIEAVLLHLQATEPAAFAQARQTGSPRIEVVPDPIHQTLRVEHGLERLPPRLRQAFTSEGRLRDAGQAGQLVADLALHPLPHLRLSQEVAPWLDSRRRASERLRLRREYEQKVHAGAYPLSETSVPLFPYQREGMLHLAFTERALLADEMGLGKTIQAIAACALLHRLGQARRVLIVTPASLKGEWEEQIQRFTPLLCQIIQGTRSARLAAYERPPFFTLVNYEQARLDIQELNTKVRPDIVILDEAQRIKTWNSQTAQSIKRLRSRYAFVLTGTPIENRIEELYSIIDFLDPTVLGPLFRFNREYYEFDDRGRPTAYRNLDKLRATLRPMMLRRRKADVENELPSRHDHQRYVALSERQKRVYAEHEQHVAALVTTAQRRALQPREQDKLMRELAMLRMICDTPFILTGADEDKEECPKLRELDEVVTAALAEEGVKVLIFSEWIRMLELVGHLLDRRKISHALHTGSVPQAARRTEVQRFKNDPECRVFLCSETGGVGLNLQNASVVINCDLPWNPARYEQRVARAWRKHQSRPVTVINLIAEHTIEHRMLTTLAVKQGLADGVLDPKENLARIPLRGGSQAMVERLQALLPASATRSTPTVADLPRLFGERAHTLLGSNLVTCEERHPAGAATATLFAVVSGQLDTAKTQLTALYQSIFQSLGPRAPRLEVIDRATADALERLEAGGLVQRVVKSVRTLEAAASALPVLNAAERAQLQRHLEQTTRQLKLTRLLANDASGFAEEARDALRKAIYFANQALAARTRLNPPRHDNVLPSPLAQHWGESAKRVENFFQNPEAPVEPLLTAVESLRDRLSSAEGSGG